MGKSLIGKLLNQGPPVSYAPPGRGMFNRLQQLRSSPEAYMRAYGKMGTLYSTVSLLASSTARPEWRLYRKNKDNRVRYSTVGEGSDQRVEVVQHPALSVINHPNDFWTRFELFEQYQQYIDLTGLNYILLGYDASDRAPFPLEMWPVRPDRIEPVPSEENYLQGYIYRAPNGENVPLQLKDVIPCRLPNPLDPYSGVGPVESILVDVDSAQYASEYNRNYFLSGAEPGGIVTSPVKLTDPEWDEFSDRWRESHQGVSRAHRVAMLEAGMTWTEVNVSQKDMDFVNLRNLSRDIVREAYGMHKVMLGVTDDVNRANAQTGEEVFYSWKVIPRLDRWKMVLNERFLPLFGTSGANVEFDYVAPAPQNREQDNEELSAKAAAALALIQAGYDPHDVLEVVGLPDMDVAAVAPAAAAPVDDNPDDTTDPAEQDQPGGGDAEPAEGGDVMSNELQAILMNALPRLNGHSLKALNR